MMYAYRRGGFEAKNRTRDRETDSCIQGLVVAVMVVMNIKYKMQNFIAS